MAKIRVHELSKQLNISNKDIIDTLGAKGIEIKSHMSNLDDSMVGIIKAKFGAKTAPKALEEEIENVVNSKLDGQYCTVEQRLSIVKQVYSSIRGLGLPDMYLLSLKVLLLYNLIH